MNLEELNMMLPISKQKSACLNESNSAVIIGVSASTMSNWRKEGIGPSYKKVDNGVRSRVLYPKTAIIEWLNNTVKTA